MNSDYLLLVLLSAVLVVLIYRTIKNRNMWEERIASQLGHDSASSEIRYLGGSAIEVYEIAPPRDVIKILKKYEKNLERFSLYDEEVRQNGIFLLFASDNQFFFLRNCADSKVKLACGFTFGNELKIENLEAGDLDTIDEDMSKIKIALKPINEEFPSISPNKLKIAN